MDMDYVKLWQRNNPAAVRLAKRLQKVTGKSPDFSCHFLRADLTDYLNGNSGAGEWLADYYGISAVSELYQELKYGTF